jgi:hypothetical protein
MNYCLPTGIGDSVWALHKIEAINQKLGGPIDVALVGSTNQVDSRALDFIKRFTFVNSVCMKPYSIHKEGRWIANDGCYDYLEDGMYEFAGTKYCVLVPNRPLEHGIRLEDWLPHHKINWDIWKDFIITPAERQVGADLLQRIGPYAVFYPGPLHGNTEDGHNRNALWKPIDWVDLGRQINAEFGLQIVLVGAPYDLSYYQLLLKPLLAGDFWHNWIGRTNLGALWSITGNSQFVISYQAGVGIVSAYRGTNTAIWWRPFGSSISPKHFLSFNEEMRNCWNSPKMIENKSYFGMIYQRDGIQSIMSCIQDRGWANAKIGLNEPSFR